MLVVRLEIHPGGDASRAREIGLAEIANVSGRAPVSDYDLRFSGDSGELTGRVHGHVRADGAWTLVLRAIVELLRKR